MLKPILKTIRRCGSASGQSVIELGLILPFLLILVFGITELGRMLMQTNMLTQACREGARVAAIGAHPDTVEARTKGILTAAGIDNNVIVTLTGPNAGNMMQVEATCDFEVIPNNLLGFGGTLTLRGVSAMRLEQ
ncbi:MAG: hypothetical protein Kow0074_16990 [Candidatus Zixiibacteriota bacterium]